jgi:hypothetical protein
MSNKATKKWDEESIRREALKYKNRHQFAQKKRTVYETAKALGILDSVCSHMPTPKRPWTLEGVRKIALCYNSPGEFDKGNHAVYSAASKNGWLDAVCSHMQRINSKIWAVEELRGVMQGYRTRAEFRKENPSAYVAVVSRGLLKEFSSHMAPPDVRDSYHPWTVEELRALAAGYNTKRDFNEAHPGACGAAWRRGIWEIITAHMDAPETKWDTEDKIREEASKYSVKKEFSQGSPGAYNAAGRIGPEFLESICSHMKRKTVWTHKRILAEAKKYQTKSEFERGCQGGYDAARNRGLIGVVCSHMPERSSPWYDIEKIKAEALKFRTRAEFYRYSSGAYGAALRQGRAVLDSVCAHMEPAYRGFNPNYPGIVYYVKFESSTELPLYKIGITNFDDVAERIKSMRVKKDFTATVLVLMPFQIGSEAFELEQMLHREYKEHRYFGDPIMANGNTELYVTDVLGYDKGVK